MKFHRMPRALAWDWSELLCLLGRNSCNSWISLAATTKLVPLSEKTRLGQPLRDIKRRFAAIHPKSSHIGHTYYVDSLTGNTNKQTNRAM